MDHWGKSCCEAFQKPYQISAQHQPGKIASPAVGQQGQTLKTATLVPCSRKREARSGSPNPQCLETLAGNGWSLQAKTTTAQHRTTKPTKTMPNNKTLNDFTIIYNNRYCKWTIVANLAAKHCRDHTRAAQMLGCPPTPSPARRTELASKAPRPIFLNSGAWCTLCHCILAEGAIALSVTLSGGALFAS
jgi:hypothetical protein